MRKLPAYALPALLLLMATPALAQVPSPTYLFTDVTGPATAVLPASVAQYNFTVERVCTNSVDVLPAAMADVEFYADSNLTIAGPGQVQFPQQVCAQESRVLVQFKADVAVPGGAAAGVHKVKALLQPWESGPTLRFSQAATTDFLVDVAATEPKGDPAPEAAAAETVPGLAPFAALAALGAAALVARRGL